MQQTDKYKLNKPGVDDPITPVPLNENMDKIEAALLTKADAALEQRVTVLEGHRIIYGTFQGNSATQVIDLGVTPKAVLVGIADIRYYPRLAILGHPFELDYFKVVENGFQMKQYSDFNSSMWRHQFLAIV